jgi:hypothetical protein
MSHILPGASRASLVELAVDVIKDEMEAQFNANLSLVSDQYADDGRKISLEKLQPNNIYISEGVRPLKLPAAFIIPSDSVHDLTAENWAYQTHNMLLAVLVEDMQAEASRITRKVWRYARAAWMTLHDKNLGGTSPSVYTLVESISYSPIFETGAGTERKFRKDATLRLRVKHLEPLYL